MEPLIEASGVEVVAAGFTLAVRRCLLSGANSVEANGAIVDTLRTLDAVQCIGRIERGARWTNMTTATGCVADFQRAETVLKPHADNRMIIRDGGRARVVGRGRRRERMFLRKMLLGWRFVVSSQLAEVLFSQLFKQFLPHSLLSILDLS